MVKIYDNNTGTVQSLIDNGDGSFSPLISTSIIGSNEVEVSTLVAKVTEQTYNFETSNYGVLIIQNLSRFTPIEFVLDGTFELPNQHITPVNQKNIQRLEPGQTIKVRRSPTLMSYRSLAGKANI